MPVCPCGSRPKKGAPSISVLRTTDVRLAIKSLTGFTFFTLPVPPVFSAIWAEATSSFCARSPDRLYLEFAPYDASELTAALKRLWTRNCECVPVKARYRLRVTFVSTADSAFNPNITVTRVADIDRDGAFIGVRVQTVIAGSKATTKVFAFVLANNYASEVELVGEVIQGQTFARTVTTYTQTRLSVGCFVGSPPDFPLKPPAFPYPEPSTVPPRLPPDAWLPPGKRKPSTPPPPVPPDCCDCC